MWYWKEDSHKALKRSESVTVKSRGHCSIDKGLCQKHKINFIMLWCQECEVHLSEVQFSVWGKTNWKEININPKLGVSTSYYRGLPTQCPTCLLSSLHLEQLPAAKTENGPMSSKLSYRIRVSFVLYLIF